MYTTSAFNCELLGVSLQFKDVLSFCIHPRTCVAELLRMKSEMDKLRWQLEYKNQVREGRTAEERETHTRADIRTSSTSDAKKRKAHDRNTTAPSAKNSMSLCVCGGGGWSYVRTYVHV